MGTAWVVPQRSILGRERDSEGRSATTVLWSKTPRSCARASEQERSRPPRSNRRASRRSSPGYRQASAEARDRYKKRILAGREDATNGWVYAAYLHAFDRIVEHPRAVTRVQTDPLFRVKPEKFKVQANPLARKKPVAEKEPLHVDTAIFDTKRVDQRRPKLAPPEPIEEEVTAKSDSPPVRRSSKKP